MHVYIISQIYKNGADIRRMPNGKLELINFEKVPVDVLKGAEPIFDSIDKYIMSVEGLNVVDATIYKIMLTMLGWKSNDKITEFINNDETALNLVMDYQVRLSRMGWTDIYMDWMLFEKDVDDVKRIIYDRAIAYFKK